MVITGNSVKSQNIPGSPLTPRRQNAVGKAGRSPRNFHCSPRGMINLPPFSAKSPVVVKSPKSVVQHQNVLQPSPKPGITKRRVEAVARQQSPRKVLPSKNKTYDRFIPSRAAMDLATSQFNMSIPSQTSACHLDASSLAYQEELAKAYGVEINKRILAFNVEAPSSEKHDVRATWNRPLKPAYHKTKRRIPLEPVRVLDAPGMVDDYYLNLLHWSSQNVLAVALDKTIFMWHADSGDVVEFCNTSDTDSIASLQFDASGDILAIGTHSGETQIWNVEKRSKIRTMKGRLSRVGVLSWDKHILSAGARDGSIWNHDVRVQNHKVSEFLGHSEDVCGLQWRLDGQLLASGGNDNLVNIWDARSSIPKITKSNHMAAVKAVAWCPWQLNLLATGGGTYDRMIHFWNSTTSSKSASIDTGSQVTSIIWSRQYKELLSSHGNTTNGAHGSLRNHLTLWNYPSLNKVADLGGHESRILHTALSPDGETVASTAPDEHLKFWKAWEAKPKTKAKAAAASLPGITGDVQKMNIR